MGKIISNIAIASCLAAIAAVRIAVPDRAGKCRFSPSCSQYALEILKKYPPHQAIGKIIWRLLKCNPFTRGGDDPAV